LSGSRLLTIPGLATEAALVHGFSTAALGSMRRGESDPSPLTPARRVFALALGLDPERLTVAGAVHGAGVGRVDGPAGVVSGVDVLVTDRRGLPLLVTCADCYPLVLFDPVRGALALAHAGWRGTAAGVAAEAVRALAAEYGSRPEDLVVGVGPGICGGCYEVSSNVAARFDEAFLRPSAGRYQLDLAAANRAQLERSGVPPERIHRHGACTRETPELPSHRRSPDGSRFACIAAIA
jgi:purine-nucleoside/S-methyl-5'-thioadenosine phosphorylase / adenosine deaminase